MIGTGGLKFIAARIAQAIPILVGVSFITFCLLSVLPGDAATTLLGSNATPQAVKLLNAQLGLNKPFFTRYWDWLSQALQGHLGVSLSTGQSVSSFIGQRAPVTLELIVLALFIALFFAIPLATVAAYRPNGIADRVSAFVCMVGLSLPSFVSALVLILLFAVKWHLVPASGYSTPGSGIGKNLQSMALPSITLAITLFALWTRVLRNDLVDQQRQQYVLTARAKGRRPWAALTHHALRNSGLGVMTLIGVNVGAAIGNALLIETVFGLPGIGQGLVQAITTRDVPVLEGCLLTCAVVVIGMNLLADVLYAILDPRIRLGGTNA
jgi:peptide/nickel transport system permease protein